MDSPQPELRGVPVGELETLLPLVWPALELMAQRSLGCFLAHDFAEALKDRRMQLWIAATGADRPDLKT